MSKIRKLIDVSKDDVHTLAVHALTTKNISFKVYVEKLLSDEANRLRKKKSEIKKREAVLD